MLARFVVTAEPVAFEAERDGTRGEAAGLAVIITDGSNKIETRRVAFDRALGSEPGEFGVVLRAEIAKAEEAAAAANQLVEVYEEQLEEEMYRQGDVIRNLLVDRTSPPA